MLNTPSIAQVKTTRPDLYAFRIARMVTQEDLEAMADVMNDAFDRHEDKVDMLLIFDRYEGSESGAGWSWEALKSRFRAISHVRRYVVVGAPNSAEDMIERMAAIMPVEAETHDTEIAAWRSLNAEAIAA